MNNNYYYIIIIDIDIIAVCTEKQIKIYIFRCNAYLFLPHLLDSFSLPIKFIFLLL